MSEVSILEWVRTLWPIGLLFGGHVVRTELAQRGNKQGIEALQEKRKDDLKAIEDRRNEDQGRMDRFERTVDATLKEMRDDIKTLLSRH